MDLAVRAVRAVGWLLAAVIGIVAVVVGILTVEPLTTLGLFLLMPSGALVAHQRSAGRKPPPGPVESTVIDVVGALFAGAATLAVGGVVALAGGATGTLAAVVCVVAATRWAHTVPQAAPVSAPRPSPLPRRPFPVTLEDVPLGELCALWRRSFTHLGSARDDPDRLGEVADHRRACLDELARRDPVGFARWMDSGARAASDPTKYLGAGGGGSAIGPDGDLRAGGA